MAGDELAFELGALEAEDPLPVVELEIDLGDGPVPRFYCSEMPSSALAKKPPHQRIIRLKDAMHWHQVWTDKVASVVSKRVALIAAQGEHVQEPERPQIIPFEVEAPNQGVCLHVGSSAAGLDMAHRTIEKRVDETGGENEADSDADAAETEQLPNVQELDNLPWKVVTTFTRSAVTLWLVAAFLHLHKVFPESLEPTQALQAWQLHTTWPAPAALFEVDVLHCTMDTVMVSSRFALYTAKWLPEERALGTHFEISSAPAIAMFCDSTGCDALEDP